MKKHSDTKVIEKLLDIMATLRDPVRGCPWDRQQTFATIAPHTIEEAYEVADAIDREALGELRDELGDLLFQVVFHARLAEEAGAFDFLAVAEGLCAKLERRHPHVFGDARVAGVAEQSRAWEEIKQRERGESAGGVLGDVPLALPALSRAAKLGRRAAAVGFDWPSVAGVRAKVEEELAELDAALGADDRAATAAELGDLLLTVASLCRHVDVDPEACLRAANRRFERRFARVEAQVLAAGGDWAAHGPAALDALWQDAKNRAD
jgi:tetrapyrrole methylase family protein/MazG family protein/ATP diphosphatase